MADIEDIIKRKISLEEENKELKEKIDELQYRLNFKDKQIGNLQDKIREASTILGIQHKVVFWKRKMHWGGR